MVMVQWNRGSGWASFGEPPGQGAVREDFLEEVTSRQMEFSWKSFQAEEQQVQRLRGEVEPETPMVETKVKGEG